MILRRDSAATRHLVWLLAMVAMLVVPVLSAMLPRVASAAGVGGHSTGDGSWRKRARPRSPGRRMSAAGSAAGMRMSKKSSGHPQRRDQPAAELPDSRPASARLEIVPARPLWSWNWFNALPLVWAIGFCLLILRLMAARWMLWNTERQGTVICGRPGQPDEGDHDPIVTALEAACLQLGICRPVTLLIHPDKTIPVVWGILRCRLLLPAAARQWSGEQLRSVLLHELAHVKRRDTMAQLLAQIACALHWFNPLVWFAAWRLGVERERACDDLVLASGVRPSAYAGHLLDVVTELSPARWTQSAAGWPWPASRRSKAASSPYSANTLNRRGVSAALAAIALAIAVGVAVPIAMLRAADEKPGSDRHSGRRSLKPKAGAKLDPGTEEKLRWGEPVNGLRAAIVIRPCSRQAKGGRHAKSSIWRCRMCRMAPIRLSDTTAAPELRELVHQDATERPWRESWTRSRHGPISCSSRARSRSCSCSRLTRKDPDGRTTGSIDRGGAAEGHANQTLVAEMKIEHARRQAHGRASSSPARPAEPRRRASRSRKTRRRRAFSNYGRTMHGGTGRSPAVSSAVSATR